jgi:cobyrinic acid a,c-diamide synthase
VRGHEFHYSSLENLGPDVEFAYRVLRGHGVNGEHDGLVHRNVLASYAHLRSVGGANWAARFVLFVAQRKSAQRKTRAITAPVNLGKSVAAM